MNALVYKGNRIIQKEQRPVPVIINEKDAIVKVTISSICTSDLHIINGAVPKAKENIVLGHEFVGEIVAIGSAVKNLKIGDRVSANCETFCGECYFCKRGYINNCINGGWELGCTIDGCQAEYVRVPYAENGLTRIPDNVSYENALFVGDILSSGYFGAQMCEIQNGDTIAIIGCGPVGLTSMICAKLKGASKIVAIDVDENRLKIAKQQQLADICLNPLKDDIEYEIKNITKNRGADCVIEAAGAQTTFEMAWKVARPNAIVAVVAMYENPQLLPLPQMYGKNLIFKTGGVDAVHCKELLRYISEGKINTDFLISKKIKFNKILQGYEIFKNKTYNILKIAVYSEL